MRFILFFAILFSFSFSYGQILPDGMGGQSFQPPLTCGMPGADTGLLCSDPFTHMPVNTVDYYNKNVPVDLSKKNLDLENSADDTTPSAAAVTPPGDNANKPDKIMSGDMGDKAACNSAYQSADTYCSAAGYMPLAGVAVTAMSQFSSAQANGDIKGACAASAKINGLMTAANTGAAIMCFREAGNCIESCANDSDKVTKCESLKKNSLMAGLQATQNAAGFAQSEQCKKMASGECVGADALQNPSCQQYCTVPAHMQSTQCQQVVASCANPTYATQNASMCACVNNPTGAGCPGALANKDSGAPNLDGLDGDGLYNTDPCTGSNCPSSQASTATPSGGGAGIGGAMGGGTAPIAGNSNPANGSGNDAGKNILQGVNGGATGGMLGYGGGGYGSGSGGGSHSSGHGSGGFDLRAFLPGGKKDPRRGLASLGKIDPSITGANGLTNFQKITRKMNEKRAELMP